MHLKHLALAAPDVGASSRFYSTYFGFSAGSGPGLMANADGFRLAIHEAAERVHPPDLLHFGFDVATSEDVWSLWKRMNEEGVTMQGEPAKHMGTLVFWCRDPAGYLVEVRAVGHQSRNPGT
jgi:catechol 2,3-dioxygenase-like lactoylglutathione lyase family enzyme